MSRRIKVPRRCLTKGCGREIDSWKRLCDPCFTRLPFERRRAIAMAGEEKAPHRVAQLTIEAAAWLEGHSPAAEAAPRARESL